MAQPERDFVPPYAGNVHGGNQGNVRTPRLTVDPRTWQEAVITIDDAVNNVLKKWSTGLAKPENDITVDHPCFKYSEEFWKWLDMPRETLDNHKRLACGKRNFPLLLLLNPTKSHELPYLEMVEQTPTLRGEAECHRL